MPQDDYRGSDYSTFYTPSHPRVIFVVDRNGPGCASVANDADRVVPAVLRHPEADGMSTRILYRDNDGVWAELRHDGAGFLDCATVTDVEREDFADAFRAAVEESGA